MNIILRAAAAAAILGATLAAPAQAQLAPYSENFEALNIASPTALSDAGWVIFGNVYDSGGTFLFGYGVFGAPNGGPGFSGIVDDQGGAAQGGQQLSIYSDYNCCQPSNGHFNGTDLVEAIVFQEFTIGAADIGSTWEFFFEAKKGNIGGATTANGFIKTLDPNAGFATTNFVAADTTATSDTWSPYTISIDLSDPALVGQLLQIGFSSTASNFEGSGIFYDNLDFSPAGGADTDGDGVDDSTDNCTNVANSDQYDSNGDNIGSLCDADVTGPGGIEDCSVNFLDLQAVKDAFFSNPASPAWNPDADFDNSGLINFVDLQVVKDQLFGPPGPSAAGCN